MVKGSPKYWLTVVIFRIGYMQLFSTIDDLITFDRNSVYSLKAVYNHSDTDTDHRKRTIQTEFLERAHASRLQKFTDYAIGFREVAFWRRYQHVIGV
jgi:hypothetical protein